MNTFSVREAIRFGWETFKKRPGFFIGAFFLISILSNLNFQMQDNNAVDFFGPQVLILAVIGIILFFVTIVAKMGANAFLLKAHDAPENVVFKDLWTPHPFWGFVGAILLKWIVISVPALLLGAVALFTLSIPVISILAIVLAVAWVVFANIKYMFVELIVMDKQAMSMQALKESSEMTKGKFGKLLILMLALGGVCLLGLLALVVGLLVAIPVVSFAFAHAYRSLQSTKGIELD